MSAPSWPSCGRRWASTPIPLPPTTAPATNSRSSPEEAKARRSAGVHDRHTPKDAVPSQLSTLTNGGINVSGRTRSPNSNACRGWRLALAAMAGVAALTLTACAGGASSGASGASGAGGGSGSGSESGPNANVSGDPTATAIRWSNAQWAKVSYNPYSPDYQADAFQTVLLPLAFIAPAPAKFGQYDAELASSWQVSGSDITLH